MLRFDSTSIAAQLFVDEFSLSFYGEPANVMVDGSRIRLGIADAAVNVEVGIRALATAVTKGTLHAVALSLAN